MFIMLLKFADNRAEAGKHADVQRRVPFGEESLQRDARARAAFAGQELLFAKRLERNALTSGGRVRRGGQHDERVVHEWLGFHIDVVRRMPMM